MAKHVIINIGRQYGSHGREIAAEISRMLDIPVYDNELLSKAAERSGFSRTMFENRDEKRRLLKVGTDAGSINDTRFFSMMSEEIKALAEEGSAIIIGRASNYILRDRTDCLDVFINAPMSVRKKFVCTRDGIPEDKVEDYINKRDRGRARYYNFFTLGHWGKASDYDLCVDSSVLGIKGTAEFIVEFGRKAGLID